MRLSDATVSAARRCEAAAQCAMRCNEREAAGEAAAGEAFKGIYNWDGW